MDVGLQDALALTKESYCYFKHNFNNTSYNSQVHWRGHSCLNQYFIPYIQLYIDDVGNHFTFFHPSCLLKWLCIQIKDNFGPKIRIARTAKRFYRILRTRIKKPREQFQKLKLKDKSKAGFPNRL